MKPFSPAPKPQDLTSFGKNPNSLEARVFINQIAEGRASELRSEESVDGSLSLSLSATEVERGQYFISVRCGAVDTRYRIVAHLIPSELEVLHPVHGEVCVASALFVAHARIAAAPRR